jgi:hypothetical protein
MTIFESTLFPYGVGLIAILVAIFIIHGIVKKDSGTDRMKDAALPENVAPSGETL